MSARTEWCWLAGLLLCTSAIAVPAAGESTSRLSDEPVPLRLDVVPDRPRPILELGNDLLATGPVHEGFTLPTLATWQPTLVVWGTYRTALQVIDRDDLEFSEWANRLDLFASLNLTSTERVLIGFRPLDEEGRFSGYTFSAPEGEEGNEGSNNELNFEVTTLFAEGDIGELLPILDWNDSAGLDIGFSVGRQDIQFQDGMLINDNIDAVGATKINLRTGDVGNHRSTLLWGFGELNRANLPDEDDSATLFGFLNEIDWRWSTVALDAIYVEGDEVTGDGFHGGISAVQRIGELNTTFRVLGSRANGEETDHNSDGLLLFGQFSKTPHGSEDFIYVNAFAGLDRFRSASRRPSAGGPLGPAGVLFEAVGLGRYGSALDSYADDAIGGAIGKQRFFSDSRKQVIFELAGRTTSEEVGQRALAAGVTYRAAHGQRTILRLDGFALYGSSRENDNTSEELGIGGRIEITCKL